MTQDDVNELEAFRRWSSGKKYRVSTNINDQLTYGYGKLDDLGFWEFQLPINFIKRIGEEL